MSEGNIWKQLLFFSIPLVLGNIFQQLYNAVDSIIVGNFVGSQALAAVTSSSPVINMLISFFMGLSIGAGVVISRYFGANDRQGVSDSIHTSMAIIILAGIAMTYGYVYVAQVAMGADMNQCIKAFSEAESYHGPSIILAYAPCINHGIKGGMGVSQVEEKKAVAAGYWHNFRFDPRRADEGQNPFQLDSKAPTASYRDFIMGEVRYNSLTRSFPDRAEKLFANAEKYAVEKYERLKKMAE